jgi:hypothetical protein
MFRVGRFQRIARAGVDQFEIEYGRGPLQRACRSWDKPNRQRSQNRGYAAHSAPFLPIGFPRGWPATA